ncbi:unnamed protein product [Amoebophrya sp. A120]|nr:unnamed protein product [Amoebophrya sp. A120]|eukprot:GSA120T00011734001.1
MTQAAMAREVALRQGLLEADADWTYVKKREAQEIVPRLYLGPYAAACNEEHMRAIGVTHCIIFRAPEENRIIKPKFPSFVKYDVIECSDTAQQNLIPLFPLVKAAVDQVLAMSRDHRILLQGTVGMSRSAAFAAAYVMESYNLSWEASIYYVGTRRNCVSVNENFRIQLREYDMIWKTRQRQQQQTATVNSTGMMIPNQHTGATANGQPGGVALQQLAGVQQSQLQEPYEQIMLPQPGGGMKRRLEYDDNTDAEVLPVPSHENQPGGVKPDIVAMDNG